MPENPILLNLITEVSEVKDNIRYFINNLSDNKDMKRVLSSFQHWYYSLENDSFAPSKFIGYIYPDEDRFSYYLSNYNEGMHGAETEKAINKLYFYREANIKEFPELSSKLNIFLNKFDKKPRKGHYIHIPKENLY